MNILEQEDIIKGLPDQALMQEAQMPSGQVPQYLVVSEIQRRSDMRKRFKEQQPKEGTVKDQVVQEGIMSMMPQMPPSMPMQPSAPPMMPPPMPQGAPPPMPPQDMAAPPQMMSGGGIVRMANGGVSYVQKQQKIRDLFAANATVPEMLAQGITLDDITQYTMAQAQGQDLGGYFSEAGGASALASAANAGQSEMGGGGGGIVATGGEYNPNYPVTAGPQDAKTRRILAGLEAGANRGFDATAGAGQRILPDFLAQRTDFNPIGFLPNYSGTNPVGDAISSAVPSFSVDGVAEDPAQAAVARSSGPFTPSGTTLEEVAGSLYDYQQPVDQRGRGVAGMPTRRGMIYDVLGSDYEGFTGLASPFPSISGRDYFIQQAVERNPEALRQYLPDSGVYRTAGANVQGDSPVQTQSIDVSGAFDDLYKTAGIPTNPNAQLDPRGLSLLGNRTRVTPGPDAVLRDAKAASDRLDDLANTEPKVDDAGEVEQQIEKVVGQSPKGEPSEFSAYLQTLQNATGNDASAPKDEAATDPAVRPELDFANLIADSRRQAMSNALIQLGSGIAAGNVAGGISAAGEAAAAGTAAAREIDMKSRLAQYEAGRQDLMREEDRSEAALERKARAFEAAQDRLLKARLSEEDRALERQRIKDQAAYQSGQLGVSRDKLEILSDQVENELKRLTYDTDKAKRVSASQLAEFVNSLVETQLDDEILEPGERARVARTLTENAFRRYSGLFDVDVSKIDFTPTSTENVAFDALKTKSTR